MASTQLSTREGVWRAVAGDGVKSLRIFGAKGPIHPPPNPYQIWWDDASVVNEWSGVKGQRAG